MLRIRYRYIPSTSTTEVVDDFQFTRLFQVYVRTLSLLLLLMLYYLFCRCRRCRCRVPLTAVSPAQYRVVVVARDAPPTASAGDARQLLSALVGERKTAQSVSLRCVPTVRDGLHVYSSVVITTSRTRWNNVR